MKPATVRRVTLADLAQLEFEDSFVRELPADPVLHNVPRPVANASYTRVEPTPVAEPRLLAGRMRSASTSASRGPPTLRCWRAIACCPA
jgi:hypothetical protein